MVHYCGGRATPINLEVQWVLSSGIISLACIFIPSPPLISKLSFILKQMDIKPYSFFRLGSIGHCSDKSVLYIKRGSDLSYRTWLLSRRCYDLQALQMVRLLGLTSLSSTGTTELSSEGNLGQDSYLRWPNLSFGAMPFSQLPHLRHWQHHLFKEEILKMGTTQLLDKCSLCFRCYHPK